jgi:hypothetical protein
MRKGCSTANPAGKTNGSSLMVLTGIHTEMRKGEILSLR